MKSSLEKELRQRFWPLGFFFVPFLFYLFSIVAIKIGLLYPFYYNSVLMGIALFISWWSYHDRIRAIKFMLAETIRVLVLACVFFNMYFYILPQNNFLWSFLAVALLILEIIIAFEFENKNWAKRQMN